MRFSSLKLMIVLNALTLLVSCGGSGGGGGGGSSVQPIIAADLTSFATGAMPPGFAPSGFNSAASVGVWDNASGDVVSTATVIMNGVTLPYNSTDQQYEGYIAVSPDDTVTLNVTVAGQTYTASGTQFTSYPAISFPSPSDTWYATLSNTVLWSGGGSTQGKSILGYFLGVLDAKNPGGDLVWPANNSLQQAVSPSTIPSYSLSGGDRDVIVGITQEVYVSDNTTYLIDMYISGFNYVPITVSAPTDITVTPTNLGVAKGTTQQFTATCIFSNGATQDWTYLVTWSSSDQFKATINSRGLATGTGVGSTIITATFGNISGETTIKVVPGFEAGMNYPDTSSEIWLGNTAIGDLNGDGRNDVAVIEGYNTSTHILIYYQKADGTLDNAQVITTDLILRGIGIADVNDDGLAELIVSGNSSTATSGPLGRVYVYKQDSRTHMLGTPQKYTLSANSVGPLAVADFNNDGLLDIVTAGTGTGASGVLSFLFQGNNGVLGPEVTYTSVSIVVDGELHVADMNDDGLNDIVLQSGPTQLAVIKQTSLGTFSTTPDFYTVQTSYWGSFRSFALGDINGDGRIDIAVADPGNNGYLNIFLQNASGTLTGPTLLISDAPSEIHIADLDGDGLNDIITLSFGMSVHIYYQSADHSFQNYTTYSLPTHSAGGTNIHQAMSIGDVTGDGLPDIIASWFDEGIFVLPRLP